MKRARYWLSWAFLIPGLILSAFAIAFIFVADAHEPVEAPPIVPRARR